MNENHTTDDVVRVGVNIPDEKTDERPDNKALIRRSNLRRLLAQWPGGATALAKKLGHSNPSFISQIAGKNPTRTMSEKMAKDIEAAINLTPGWLDKMHVGVLYERNVDKFGPTYFTIRPPKQKIGFKGTSLEDPSPLEPEFVEVPAKYSNVQMNVRLGNASNAMDHELNNKIKNEALTLTDLLDAIREELKQRKVQPTGAQMLEIVRVMWNDMAKNNFKDINANLLHGVISVVSPE